MGVFRRALHPICNGLPTTRACTRHRSRGPVVHAVAFLYPCCSLLMCLRVAPSARVLQFIRRGILAAFSAACNVMDTPVCALVAILGRRVARYARFVGIARDRVVPSRWAGRRHRSRYGRQDGRRHRNRDGRRDGRRRCWNRGGRRDGRRRRNRDGRRRHRWRRDRSTVHQGIVARAVVIYTYRQIRRWRISCINYPRTAATE